MYLNDGKYLLFINDGMVCSDFSQSTWRRRNGSGYGSFFYCIVWHSYSSYILYVWSMGGWVVGVEAWVPTHTPTPTAPAHTPHPGRRPTPATFCPHTSVAGEADNHPDNV